MNRALSLFVIGLIFGGGLGFAFAAASGAAFEPHDHADPAHHVGTAAADKAHSAAHATPREVAASEAPRLDIALVRDPEAGWNLHVMAEEFRFAPARASGAHVPGEGHAHLYVNGQKRARLYGPWLHIDRLPPGEVEIEVTLTGNDHRPLASGGRPIAARTLVTVE